MFKRKFRNLLIILILLTIGVFLFFNTGSSDLNIQDQNKNGIWDDLDQYIEKNAVNKIHKRALEEYFISFQKDLLDPSRCMTDEQEASLKSIVGEFEKVRACLGVVAERYGVKEHLHEDVVVNTIGRARAYNKFNAECSGGFFGLWDEETMGSPCDFSIE